MFLIVYDKSLKEKVLKDNRFTFLYENNVGKKSSVFCLDENNDKNRVDFASEQLFEFGINDNPKYRITQILTF